MALTAEFWINHLKMEKHIEGGAFARAYQSPLMLTKEVLPEKFTGERHICTHIYFLLQKQEFSAFHRLQSDELWHFYYGDPLIIYEIDEKGNLKEHFLGNDPSQQQLVCAVKGGNWFAARLKENREYALVGCTASPGFDYDGFELADRNILAEKYPGFKKLIEELTY